MRLTLPLGFAQNPCVCRGSGLFPASAHPPAHPAHLRVISAPRTAVAGSLAPDAENPVFPMPPAVCNIEITPITPAVKRCRCEVL